MKITTKQIRKVIKEELKKVLNESYGLDDFNIHAFTRLEDYTEAEIPLVYGNELMVAYELSAARLFMDYFNETLSNETIDKLINIVNDDVREFCIGESGRQAQELIKQLDPKFKGIAVGDIRFDDEYGYCDVQVTLGSNGLEVVSYGSHERDSEGFIEVELGTYGFEPNFEYTSIMNPSGNLFDVYFRNLDAGSGGYGNQDVQGSVDVNIDKIIADVNQGNLGLDINGREGEPMYVVKTRYDG